MIVEVGGEATIYESIVKCLEQRVVRVWIVFILPPRLKGASGFTAETPSQLLLENAPNGVFCGRRWSKMNDFEQHWRVRVLPVFGHLFGCCLSNRCLWVDELQENLYRYVV